MDIIQAYEEMVFLIRGSSGFIRAEDGSTVFEIETHATSIGIQLDLYQNSNSCNKIQILLTILERKRNKLTT